MLNSARQVGGSLGIAVMGAIVASQATYLAGFHDALRVGGLLCLVGAGVAVAAIRKIEHPQRAGPRGRGAGRGRMTQVKQRLTAEARRQAVLDTAGRVFSRSSYRGATTAEIAREAGISEPILYRHFGSKRDLYLACLDEAWASFRAGAERAIAEDPLRVPRRDRRRVHVEGQEDPPHRPVDPGADGLGRGQGDRGRTARARCGRCTTSSRS